jgi:biotin transporter BioY
MNWTLTGNVRRLRRKSLLGQLVLLALGVELLLFASFTSIALPTPTQHNIERCINLTVQQLLPYLPEQYQVQVLDEFRVLRQQVPPIRLNQYSPVCPAAIFLGYVLGLPVGPLAALLFFLLGLVGPHFGVLPFAEGGGWQYYRQPGFGYLIGTIAGSWACARLTLARQPSSLRQAAGIIAGLALTHGIGLTYLIGGSITVLVFENEATRLAWQPWLLETIRNLSWYGLPYDALTALTLVGLGFPFRWLTSIVTAPDLVMQPKRKWDTRQLEQVS